MSRPDDLAILYVDDDLVNLRVFEANFGNRFSVLTCASGAEALDIVHSGEHELAVVLADERMPGMTGSELLEKLAELAPFTQRMVVTAYADMNAVMRAVNRAKVARYYYKPWVREELLAALEDAVHIYQLQRRLRTADGAADLCSDLEREVNLLEERCAALRDSGNSHIAASMRQIRELLVRLRTALDRSSGTGVPRREA